MTINKKIMKVFKVDYPTVGNIIVAKMTKD